MKKKQILTISIAVILVMLISVAGTLAYLTAKQDGAKAVVNTFVAAGNGGLIDDGPVPTIPGLQNGFILEESKATYDETTQAYTLDTDTKVLTNTYDNVAPNMEIPKDPTLTVNIEDGAQGYIFIKVTSTLNVNLTYALTSDWVAVDGVEGVYVYQNRVVKDETDEYDVELDAVQILADNKVTVANVESFGLADDADGALGELKFEAYACQAQGFATAAEAWTACFGG